jgi:phosphoribosylformylglycinamidine cyclo-ligase
MSTYAQAGVNIALGDRLVQSIKKVVRSTYSRSVLGDVGAFGAFFEAKFPGYKRPVLVSSVDGVGTKLIIAQMMGRHNTVGQDLVNHCVNDIAVCGAKPLYFLDYFATGRLRLEVAGDIIKGFAKACRENHCALIGGETAEMPGLYGDNEYDLCGTIVGVVEKSKILTGKRVKKGDVLIGLASNGLHTNGYSLARASLLRKYSVDEHVAELGMKVGDALLGIHRSYYHIIRALLRTFDVHGLAHITGGGIAGNTMRVIPGGLTVLIDWNAWERPPIFSLIQKAGRVPEEDMRRTFNLGIGLVVIVPETRAKEVMQFLRRKREEGFIVGKVVPLKKSGDRG